MRRALIVFTALLGFLSPALAVDSTVPNMGAAGAVSGTDGFYCIQGNGTTEHECTAPQIGAFANGVFNVRSQYGGVPDGSTSNTTAINNAFTAASAFTSGAPTVYFDCDTGTTTCVYNYAGLTGGGGLSPVNMKVPMTILCAPGATLNYTGTAHAVEMGSTSLTSVTTDRFLIQGCRFTGGASYTHGIYINNWVANAQINDNVFRNFGNQTGYTIEFAGNNWIPTVSRNLWTDNDGFTKNILDSHSASALGLRFTENQVECETVSGTACSIVTTGVGLWLMGGFIHNNTIQYHYPLIRISSVATNPIWIDGNHFEGNFGGATPAITYGDPGTTGTNINYMRITNNFLFWPVATNTNVFIGPESASSGTHQFSSPIIMNNFLSDSTTMSGTGKVIQTNGGAPGQSYFYGNLFNNQAANQSLTNFIDSAYQVHGNWGVYNSGGTSLANSVPAFDANGVDLDIASFHFLTKPLLCSDVSGSGTAKVCATTPQFNVSGATFTPVAGDCFTFTSTTGVTGSATVAVNSTTAATMKKTGGTANLASGDLKAGGYYPMCFDGTNYQVTIGQ